MKIKIKKGKNKSIKFLKISTNMKAKKRRNIIFNPILGGGGGAERPPLSVIVYCF